MSKQQMTMLGMIALLIMACSASESQTVGNGKPKGRPAVAVEVLEVKPVDIAETIAVVGTLAPKSEAEVKSEYSGIITDVFVTEWVRVSRGTQLAKLDMREAAAALDAAKALLAQAQVSENKAVREYERALGLKKSGLITQQLFDDAVTAREAAVAATASAQAQVNMAETRLEKTLITAPIDGVISYRGVNVGDYIENMGSPRPMFKIVDNRVLDLTVTVPSARMADIRIGQDIDFSTNAFNDKTYNGKIKYINPEVDPTNRSVKVIAEVSNDPEELRGGLFVKGRIVTGARKGVRVVPRSALKLWDVVNKRGEVFVVSNQKASLRPVTTGTLQDDLVEITSGLDPGELVVTRGAFNINDGDRVKIQPAKEK
ncbi:MAG: efflux RND transporter periplasmic adaptor subunit [Thermodesulfobacteriota bacterium]